MIKKNVLLVGCGGIGVRHLQALTLLNNLITIDILEKKKKNQIIRDLITTNNRIKINYFNHIKKIKKNYDIIIFATTSRFTFKVFLEILKYSSTKNILFEKITFAEIKQYSLAKKLLNKNRINAWVNCSNRYQNWVKYIKKNIKPANKFNLVCEGQNDNLISNFVHYFDLFNYLSNEKKGKLISLNLYNLYKSKRKTYFDSEGEGIVTNKKKNTLTYVNKIIKEKKFQINYSLYQKNKNTITIKLNENNVNIVSYKNKKKIKYQFKNIFQSRLTKDIVKDIFSKKCKLITYDDYQYIQLQILRKSFKIFKISNKKNIRFS